ncbi:Hpt domain-containing protein [Phaeovulum sp.]|uniref:Hpt domain-containing protein n=1 Tax=Phaeovulum sp. TaxID=2934796 RepID=UPI00356651A6
MIDWERVTELHDEIGEESFAEVVDLFLDEVESILTHLGTCPQSLGDHLHFLKGSAWNIGFATFGAACQEGERQATAGHAAEVDIAAILSSYERSKMAFFARVGEFCESGRDRVS